MKINMGSADRVIRIILAFVIAALYFTGTISGISWDCVTNSWRCVFTD